MLRTILTELNREEGHAGPGVASLVAGVGAVLLGIGAAGDDLGWLAIAGGIVLGVGVVAALLLDHVQVDYNIFERLEKLEGK
jgi:hypothetical protein